MYAKIILRTFGIIAILLTVFPYISWNQWYIRIFDFPHLQLTLLTLVALLVYFLKFNIKSFKDYLFVAALSGCFLFQAIKIYPYTAFSDFEVKDSSTTAKEKLSLYTLNVLQKNEKFSKVIDNAKKDDADILLFTETNQRWVDALRKEFLEDYKYHVAVPLENTYGMLLLSKQKLYQPQIKYIVEDTIPSIHTKLIFSSNDTLQLYAIHPAPPTPQHNPSSVDRDAEMMKITRLVRNSELPVIVLGDFNDVAWSETTALFQNVSGLLDLRKGRGFYSTYNAKNWLMRWPLDHVFTSSDFRISKVHRGDNVGSDHFPFFTQLSYEPELAYQQELPPPTKNQLETAFKQLEEEKEEDFKK